MSNIAISRGMYKLDRGDYCLKGLESKWAKGKSGLH